MPPTSPQDGLTIRPPHPLAIALIERLAHLGGPGAIGPILDFATGSGRNSAALVRAGYGVAGIDDRTAERSGAGSAILEGAPFPAAISTHGFLHGTAGDVARRVRLVAESLDLGAPLYATFGSTHDARFERGRRIDAATYAPLDGDERDVAHAYFSGETLAAMLSPAFEIESIEERGVDDVAGSWAHQQRPLERAVHWFVVATRR